MALSLPAGFNSVGIRNGRSQATNRGQDQRFVFAMLKAIPEAQGGARQQLAGEPVPMLGDGRCNDFLAELILSFQRSTPTLASKDGVVDPGGATLALMMRLSGAVGALPARPAAPAAPAPATVKPLPNTEATLGAQRLRLLQACASANSSSGGRPRQPTADELRGFFITAGTEAVPTLDEARRSLKMLSTGCYIQGKAVRQWCGIYACTVAISAGLSHFKWTLMGGHLVGPQRIWGHQGLLPGDIATIAAYNHHFLVTGFADGGVVPTLEGNTTGQLIRSSHKKLADIVAFYRTVPL